MFILRVDDCGWEPTNKNPDADLKWFREYREVGGFEGLPVVWAFIPTTIGAAERNWIANNIKGEELVAVHGWDHADGAIVERKWMNEGKYLLNKTPYYVPPFNRYDKQTIKDWGSLNPKAGCFFGGFTGEHHREGSMPTLIGDVVHLPATRALYGRAHEVLDALPQYQGLQCPIVVTLHVTWDIHGFRGLRELRDALKPELVSPNVVNGWLARASINLDELSAPHYAAYKWITDRIPVGGKVLDFGSRYSKLPSLMALRGGRVSVCDRDAKTLVQEQRTISRKNGAVLDNMFEWDGSTPLLTTYDAVTACWSIQHNFPISRQQEIISNLADVIVVGGSLFVVSSFSPDKSFEQMNRADPQLVLNLAGHDSLIEKSGMQLSERAFFHYDHKTPNYNWCSPSEANAVAYRLVKDR